MLGMDELLVVIMYTYINNQHITTFEILPPTRSLYGPESLRSWWSLSGPRNFPPFVEPEVSLPCSLDPVL